LGLRGHLTWGWVLWPGPGSTEPSPVPESEQTTPKIDALELAVSITRDEVARVRREMAEINEKIAAVDAKLQQPGANVAGLTAEKNALLAELAVKQQEELELNSVIWRLQEEIQRLFREMRNG
jgi:chromosome segregation ATPase